MHKKHQKSKPKKQNYTTIHPLDKQYELPKEKKNIVLYLNADGKYDRLYEAQYQTTNADYIVKMDENDPRLKLQRQREEEEWERFKKKNMKIRVNEFKSEEERKYYLESKEPLPINPHMIVLPKEPKKSLSKQRKRKTIKLSDLPREGNIYIKDDMQDYFDKQFDDGLLFESDYIDLRLIHEINLRHPRKFDPLGKPSKYSFCDSLGFFGFLDKDLFGDFNKFGVGLVDYFRLLKSNIIFYLIIALIGFFALCTCGENLKKLSDVQKFFGYSNLKDFFMKLSFGNILLKEYYKCKLVDETKINNITLTCENYPKNNYYYVDKSSLAIFQISNETVTETYDKVCDNYAINKKYKSPFIRKSQNKNHKIKKYITCNKRHSLCSIDISKYKKDKNPFPKSIFIQYKCFYSRTSFYNSGRGGLIYFFTLLIIILYILYYSFLFIMFKKSNRVQSENFYQINQYTVHVKNVNINPKPPKLYQDLNLLVIALINAAQYRKVEESDLEICDEFNDDPIYESPKAIYQISYCIFDNLYLDLIKDKFKLLSTIEVPNYTKEKVNIYSSPLTNNKYNLDLKRDKKQLLIDQIGTYNSKINIEKHVCDNVNINDVFVTFKTKKHAEKCYNCYNSKPFFFRYIIGHCTKNGKKNLSKFYYKDQWLDIEYIPSLSDGIKYENLRIDGLTRYLPKPMSVLIVFILVVINIYIQYIQVVKERKFDLEFVNYMNCDLYISMNKESSFISINDVISEESESDLSNRYNTFCQCKYNLVNFGKKTAENFFYEKSLDSISGTSQTVKVFPCRKWLRTVSNTNIFDFYRYFILVIFNCFSLRIIQILPYYERYKTKMEERKRLMSLVFFYGIFANGLNTILTNIYVSNFFSEKLFVLPLLTGKYINLNELWYYNVSSSICVIILLNAITPYIIEYIKFGFMTFIRYFCCKKIVTEKNKYKFLFWFIGPEYHLEIKLGNHLSLISILMLCNFGVTNFISFIILSIVTFISFYLDKILFIRYCKTPENYSQALNQLYLKYFWNIIIISCVTNIYSSSIIIPIIHETMPFFLQLKTLLSEWKFWIFILIAVIMILYDIIRYSLIPFLIFCLFQKKNIAYGFANDKAFEKNFMKDFTIYEVLPLGVLYKNYMLRLLEYSQIQKYSLYHNVNYLLEFYRERLDYDRMAIQEKIRLVLHKNIELDVDFDTKLKSIMSKYNKELDDTKIKENFSYNMAYYDLFESAYMEKMLQH